MITFPSLECAVCDILQVLLMGSGGRGDDAYPACQSVLDRAKDIDWAENSFLLADCHPSHCKVFELWRIWINSAVSSGISQVSAKQTSAKLNKKYVNNRRGL